MSQIDKSKENIAKAIIELGGNNLDLENDILCLPVQCYAQDSRFYHNNTHRIEIAQEIDSRLSYLLGGSDLIATANALKCLVGTYHDIVQMNIDGKLPNSIMRIVNPYIIESNGEYFIKEDLHRLSSKRLWAVLDLFDLELGQKLSFLPTGANIGAMNEFLSALVAMDELHRAGLPLKNIIRVIVGVAATIPFRGQEFIDDLLERLDNLHIGLTDDEIKLTAIIAVEAANSDVHDFKEEDFLHFIQGTWRLLPEYSLGLRCEEFPIKSYRDALCQTLCFLRDQVQPDKIFNHAFGYPTNIEIENMINRAKKNIATGCLYVQTKLVSVGFLEAVGSLAAPTETLKGLIFQIPPIPYNLTRELSPISQEVYATLVDREDELEFDTSNSPIGEFIFAILDDQVIIELSNLLEDIFSDDDKYPKYRLFLSEFRRHLGRKNFEKIIDQLVVVAKNVAPNSQRNIKLDGVSLILDAVNTA